MGERRLCPSRALPEGGVLGLEVESGEGPLALVLLRREGRVLAWRNRCPHRGVNLDWVPGRFLDVEGRHLQCATHGALFRPEDGLCIHGPCAGEALESLPVEEREDGIWLLR